MRWLARSRCKCWSSLGLNFTSIRWSPRQSSAGFAPVTDVWRVRARALLAMRALALAAGLSAAPVLSLAVMIVTGWATALPALAAMAATLIVAAAIAAVWQRGFDLVTEALRSIAVDAPAAQQRLPRLRSMGRLGREVERLSRRVAARAALIEHMRRADAAIVERLPDPLIVLAEDGRFLRANPAAHAAFGGEMPALLRHPGLRSAIDRVFAHHTVQSAELVLPVPVLRDLHAAVVPLDPPLADGGQAVVVLSDRTRERAVERMRADFVANASHELRTPLASLIGFIETLRGPAADDPPAQHRFLSIMAEQAARMNRLIGDLLSLSRIELVEHQPPSERVDLATLLPPMTASFEPSLKERAMRLEMRIAENLPAVVGDGDQILQVVQNLLDNAVKYGREGSTVSLEVHSAPPGSRWRSRPGVVLIISDQGPGISREHLPRLTERFYRVDKGRSRAVGGTGLGLAIVKHIVNRHRGHLMIESEEGIGTTVTVWLPTAAARAEAIPTPSAQA
ncbi:MAG: two-component sensor histidine kinase [Acetobacteraceae bacterium]|nr:two-component sensor histidine kinase [Acetobacteraceae bacterium]